MNTNIKLNEEFEEYVSDYVERVLKVLFGCVEFESFVLAEIDDVEHHIYKFKIIKEFDYTKEIVEVLTEDDDSQPHNQYRVYIGDLFIYSTRYH